MHSEYFYRLGHQGHIGLTELSRQGLSNLTHTYQKNYTLSDKYISANLLGSIPYSGRILQTLNIPRNPSITDIWTHLEATLRDLSSQGYKKIGLSLELRYIRSKLLPEIKKLGFKQVNILPPGQTPNYGHWKQSKHWLVGFQHDQNLVLGKILDYSDQEFWAQLDQELPGKDMQRGIINLKLGRTLLNLTPHKHIWDPFCGQGRLICAGLDIKESFIASDSDPTCLPDVTENYQTAKPLFRKYLQRQNPENYQNIPLASLLEVFTQDATTLGTKNLSSQTAIVTEGYLGFNFKHAPNPDQIQTQWGIQKNLWNQVLQQANLLRIPQIICCLPAYKIKNHWQAPDFIDKVHQNTDYIPDFTSKSPLIYARPDSFVGHTICAWTLN